jgi:hypothetical protein
MPESASESVSAAVTDSIGGTQDQQQETATVISASEQRQQTGVWGQRRAVGAAWSPPGRSVMWSRRWGEGMNDPV